MAFGITLLGQGAAADAQEQAASADQFVESIGVCTHWNYTPTPYRQAYTQVRQLLVDSGIRHVRDGLTPRVQELGQLGITTDVLVGPAMGTVTEIKEQIKAINQSGPYIDAVEGPNEADLFWPKTGTTYQGLGFPAGTLLFQKDLYNAFKSDLATAGIAVLAPTLGRAYNNPATRPYPDGSLTSITDYGNFHPYPYGGNPFNYPFAYDTLAKYYWQSNFPSVNIDEYPYAMMISTPAAGPRQMVATETGYSTYSAGASETAQAKYIPRLFCEYFRKGIARTYAYEFVDELPTDMLSMNFGLVRNNLTPKPAYTALKNLIQILQEPGVSASFRPGSLDYSLQVFPNGSYTRTQYVHHLLLQKSTGDFYLLLWHEIANEDISVTPHRQITPPDMPVTLTLKKPVTAARVFLPNERAGALVSYNNVTTLNLQVPDRVLVVRLRTTR